MSSSNNIIQFPATTLGGADEPNRSTTASADVISFREKARGRIRNAKSIKESFGSGEVWQALIDERLVVHYQPQYDMQTYQTVAVEALVRLIDRQGQIVYPDRFIGLVEDGDMIVPLGRSVIEAVCADLSVWRNLNPALQHVAINVSAHQLELDTGLLDFIDQTLADYALSYSDLEFELTERQKLSANGQGTETLHELAERGSRIVLDDFGVGYCTLPCLTNLPVSAIKLDRALISQLDDVGLIASIVQHVIHLARDIGVDVVAEGIETRAQHDLLAAWACQYGQGFGYARPMPNQALQLFLAQETAEDSA